MNNHFRVHAIGALTAAFLWSAGAMAQEKKASDPAPQVSQAAKDEMMKKWQETMTPGAPHKTWKQ